MIKFGPQVLYFTDVTIIGACTMYTNIFRAYPQSRLSFHRASYICEYYRVSIYDYDLA